MEVRAQINHLRMSARKVRLATQFIKGMDIATAQQQLQFSPRASSRPALKLLNSAVANAVNNFELDKNNLYIKEYTIGQGETIKRFRPRAFGRAGMIRKRSAHLTIILAEKKPTSKGAKKTAGKKRLSDKGKLVSYEEIKKESTETEKSKPEFRTAEREKKPFIKFKEIKDKFIRRSGEK
ncbi:MAG: 50S ribosomal protein L22 [Patescibacteria group bacterium]|nr:50S ribosomal protein L22 [Patescibacteria group bacterium]